MFEGTAKPTPSLPPDSLSIWELTPTTLPFRSSSGPPELPWLIAASVWIASSMAKLFGDGDLAVQRADDARGDRLLEAEGAADRNHAVTDFQLRRVAELERLERGRRGVDVEDRDVGRRVAADDRRVVGLAVPEGHLDRLGAVDDVLVRDHVALLVVDEAGALRLLRSAVAAEGASRLTWTTVISTTAFWLLL